MPEPIVIEPEDIAAIKNALRVILEEARRVYGRCLNNGGLAIITQIRRIEKLLKIEKME